MSKTIRLETIEKALRSTTLNVRVAAMNACAGRDVPAELIEQGLKDSHWRVRAAAINACAGRDVPAELIEQGLKDSHWGVRAAAMNACAGRDVPLEMIEQGLKDEDCDVRVAAMNACAGRDIPLEVIEQGLKDSHWGVRKAAMEVCKKNGLPVQTIRTFEPPELVYKKCLADVIVVAEIPKDAQVRGAYGCKCRASKAIIRDIIGDFQGEKVGISTYDKVTSYHVGDEVFIENFDMSDRECSTGFHFFCTKEKAENY